MPPARGLRQCLHQRGSARRVGVAGGIGEQFEGERLERVARQHRRRLIPLHMHRRLAAAQVVVVHAGQVVVDEAVGVQRLDRRRRRTDCASGTPNSAAPSITRNPRSRLPPRTA
jgi:hypothetical protein